MAAVKFIVQFPIANTLRFTQVGVPNNERASFDQRKQGKVRNAINDKARDYFQLVEKGDPQLVQFYNNYPNRRLKIVDCDGNIYNPFTGLIGTNSDAYVPAIYKQYRNQKYYADCKFASVNGKLFIYFDQGNQYQSDFTTIIQQVDWGGTLPEVNVLVGDVIAYDMGTGFNTAVVTALAWSPSLQAEGYLTNIDAVLLNPVDGTAQLNYDDKPADLYAQFVDWSQLPEGIYKLVLELGTGGYTRIFETEPIDLRTIHEDTLAIDYRHDGTYDDEENWGFIYPDNYFNSLRFPSVFYEFIPAGEIDEDQNDTGEPRMNRAVPYRQLKFEAYNIPSWLADKLLVVFSHDNKVINNYTWVNDNLGSFDLISGIDMGKYSINLKQKNDRLLFTTEFEEDLTASFTPAMSTLIAFSGGSFTTVFNTNSGASFQFISIPSWLHPNKLTFVDGDIITIDVDANAIKLNRESLLVAVSAAFSGLEADLYIQQNYDTTPVDFLEVDPLSVVIPGPGGSRNVSVNASGPWETVSSGSWSFQTNQLDVHTLVISEVANDTQAVKTGTIRVRLISNPSIFKDVSVVQNTSKLMFSLSPGLQQVGKNGGNFVISVICDPTAQWQAYSAEQGTPAGLNKWLNFDTDVKTGPQNFNVHADAKPPYIPTPMGGTRYGSITFININNSTDTLLLQVEQNDSTGSI